jgi:molecular chaperone GrpE
VSELEPKTDGEEAAEDGGEGAEGSPLEQLQAERDKLKDQLLRTAADFDNYRKRTRKDTEVAEKRGREEVLRELLPVFDNLERAVQAGGAGKDVSGVLEGIEMVLKLFEDTAQRIGLTRIEAVGQRFDPSIHDAFQQIETSDQAPGTIINEYQPGYRLGDKLLRPAMVVVARKPSEPKDGGG